MMNSFKRQLENVTKPIEQVNSEELNVLKCQIENEYSLIKQKMLEMAKSGQYTLENRQKEIILNYESALLENFIRMTHKIVIVNRTLSNPTGDCSNEVIYEIIEQEKYDFFVDTLERLSVEDDISITPVMFKYDKHYVDKDIYKIPCAIHGFRLTTNSYQPILRCVVRY